MEWMQPEDIKRILREFGLTPNKGLGQNFFTDEAALRQIVDRMEIHGENVLEIGPGLGALTGLLCQRAKQVVAVEKDRRLAEALTGLVDADNLTVRQEDFLKTDLNQIAAMFPDGYHAVGNLPYYITSPIAMRLLSAGEALRSMTLMVQREAAERFFAQPSGKQYGPLAVLAGLFWSRERVAELHPSQYWPQPEVDSAVVRLIRRQGAVPEGFLSFLEGIFLHRRKTLYNNLKGLGFGPELAAAAIGGGGFSAAVRAEALSPEQIWMLYRGF